MAAEVGQGVLVACIRLRDLGSALFENVLRYEAGRREKERGDDYGVVEMPDQGNEIRNKIDRAQGVHHGSTEEPAGMTRSPGVLQGNLIDPDLTQEPLKS